MKDVVKLNVPAKVEYIMPVRLFISGIAARNGFDVDAIEDIKLLTAEACSMLFCDSSVSIDISAQVDDGCICFTFESDGDACCKNDTTELSRMIIEAYAGDVVFCSNDGRRHISFVFGAEK